jgi:WD40 repeat protein
MNGKTSRLGIGRVVIAFVFVVGCGKDVNLFPAPTVSDGGVDAAPFAADGAPDAASTDGQLGSVDHVAVPDAAIGDSRIVFTNCGTFNPVPDAGSFPPQGQSVLQVAVSRDGKLLAAITTASDDPAIWQLEPRAFVRSVPGIVWPLALAFSPDASLITVAGDGANVYRMSDGQFLGGTLVPAGIDVSFEDQSPVFAYGAFSPDGALWAAGAYGKILVHRIDDFSRPIAAMDSQVSGPPVAFSPDSKLVTNGRELWRIADGRRLWLSDTLASPRGNIIRSAEFSPDGSAILVSDCQMIAQARTCLGTVALLRTADGSVLRVFGSLARSPSFSPDGTLFVAGSKIVDVATGAIRGQIIYPSAVSSFLPDGRIAAGGDDGLIRLLCR